MGGRGASSGISKGTKNNPEGNPYGSQYHSVYEYGQIKFVQKNPGQSEALMETMTRGRIYVEVGGDDLLRIVFFDNKNRRAKVIERDKRSKAKNEEDKWHIHYGYEHDEFSEKHRDPLTGNDKAILAKVIEVWQNKRRADGGNGALQP